MVIKARLPLFWKILLLVGVVSVVPLIAAMALSLNTATDVAEELVQKNLMQHARQVSQRIGYTLVSMESDLDVLARRPASGDSYLPFTLDQRRELYSMVDGQRRMETVPKYREVGYFATDGVAIALVVDDSVVKPGQPPKEWCEEEDFVAAAVEAAGGFVFSGLVGCPFPEGAYEPAEGRLGSRFDGGIRVSRAVLDRHGNVEGVVTLVLAHLHLDWALESIEEEGSAGQLWGAMVDREGRYVAHPRARRVRKGVGEGALQQLVAAANDGAHGSAVWDDGEKPWVVACHPVRARVAGFGEQMPSGHVLVFYPREQAVAVANLLRSNFGFLVGITILLLLLGTVLLARHISAPVRTLAGAALALAKGQPQEVHSDRGDEIGDLARSFEQMQNDLEVHREALLRSERLAAVGRFVAGINHETKNVLGALGNYLRVLERKVDDTSKEKIIAPMRRALEQLDTLSRRMRELSLEPKFAQTDLVHVLKHTVQLVEPQSRNQHVTIDYDGPEQLDLPRADGSLLGQVFLNLLLNALDASGRDGRVHVSVKETGGRVEVAVQDSGPGFPAGDLSELLEPFYTTKAGGTGLGLYICRTIVQRHDGELRLENGPEGGARVTLVLTV
jgi:signal transduction histidine kinase